MKEGREGGREEGREGGREGGRKGGREEGKERGREGGRKEGKETAPSKETACRSHSYKIEEESISERICIRCLKG